jgi:predicted nucleic acid-binding protein
LILPFSKFEGNILVNLRKTGQTIGMEDVLIAASALTKQCTVVTATRHFSRIKAFKVENWREHTSKKTSGP